MPSMCYGSTVDPECYTTPSHVLECCIKQTKTEPTTTSIPIKRPNHIAPITHRYQIIFVTFQNARSALMASEPHRLVRKDKTWLLRRICKPTNPVPKNKPQPVHLAR